MSTYYIKPKLPTILSHKEYHEISATNLLLSAAVPLAHIIPEIVDIERFNDAVATALSRFPHIAGRLVRPDTPDAPWAIHLTNSGIPVTVTDSDADKVVETDLGVQYPLRLAQPVAASKIIVAEKEADHSLFLITITRFNKLGVTSIGTSLSHSLFDGTGGLMFLKTVSEYYQGLEPTDPLPWFEPEAIKYPEPSPAAQVIALDKYDPSGPLPWALPHRTAMDFVAFRLTASQVAEVHKTMATGREHMRISRADVLTAILTRCLSEVEAKPINTIMNVVNHRGMGIYPLNAVVNAVFWLPTPYKFSKDADIHDDVLDCVTELRKSLKNLRNPDFIKDSAAGLAKVQTEVSWEKMGQDLPAALEGTLTINSLWKMPWRGPHFGYPDTVVFYHGQPPGPRYVKLMAASPKFVDGKWIDRSNDIEVTFYVPPGMGKKTEGLFEGYARSLGMTGPMELLA